MKTTPHRHPEVRHEQIFAPRHDDPYLDAGKPAQDARCPECGVVFHNGRWAWGPVPKDAVADDLPGLPAHPRPLSRAATSRSRGRSSRPTATS